MRRTGAAVGTVMLTWVSWALLWVGVKGNEQHLKITQQHNEKMDCWPGFAYSSRVKLRN